MRKRFGARALTWVLGGICFGWVGGISAQVQTPSAGKAVGASSTAPARGESSSLGRATASLKEVAPVSEPPDTGAKAPQDLMEPAAKGDPSDSYIVGIADGLLISVWKEPDFSGPLVVRSDGMITLAVIGDIHVAGLTTKQVQNLLTEKLKPVVTEPQVTVLVRDLRSTQFNHLYRNCADLCSDLMLMCPNLMAPAAKGERSDSYIVGIADGLLISVWEEPDFSGPLVVRSDGMITLAVIGDIHVAGLTTKQVQNLLTEKLKPVVTEPQVTVLVRDLRSTRFNHPCRHCGSLCPNAL